MREKVERRGGWKRSRGGEEGKLGEEMETRERDIWRWGIMRGRGVVEVGFGYLCHDDVHNWNIIIYDIISTFVTSQFQFISILHSSLLLNIPF